MKVKRPIKQEVNKMPTKRAVRTGQPLNITILKLLISNNSIVLK